MLILFRHLFIFERLLCGENSFFFRYESVSISDSHD